MFHLELKTADSSVHTLEVQVSLDWLVRSEKNRSFRRNVGFLSIILVAKRKLRHVGFREVGSWNENRNE